MNAPQALYWYHQQPRQADYRNSSANRTGPYITELDMTGQPGVFKLVKYVPEAELAAEREKVARLLAALERMVAIHDEPSGFAGKYGKALDAAIDAQAVKIDAALESARAAIRARGGQP